MSVFRPEFIEALRIVAAACEAVEQAGYGRPVIVGGAAVEFYTGGAVISGDVDVVTSAQFTFEEALVRQGFRREDRQGHLLRGLYHPMLGMGVEVVSGELFDGRADRRRLVVIDLQPERAVIPPVEDMIADRLGQYSASPRNRNDMLEQAIALFVLAEWIDAAYLEKRIREETAGELGVAFLKEHADERTGHHD